jgi:hypothetical protein
LLRMPTMVLIKFIVENKKLRITFKCLVYRQASPSVYRKKNRYKDRSKARRLLRSRIYEHYEGQKKSEYVKMMALAIPALSAGL